MELSGRVALISGGARGLGAATARLFVAEGASVVIGDILDDEGARTAAALGDAGTFTHLDVRDESDWQRAIAMIDARFGRLDILVNNAGVLRRGSLKTFSRADFDDIMAINVTGAFLGTKYAAPLMERQKSGSIVNVSSNYGIQASHALHGYVASKFALRGLTKSTAAELARSGVRVNSVHPAAMKTDMVPGLTDDAAMNRLGRIPLPEEVAKTVLFLASDQSSFSTGAEFLVDGGQTQLER
ncbi:MAG: 3-alpha-hydroxysteroid dehydrogenase [Frondihabitans sp.]|nr:3-alpha-hydroxysteroid dehydrogenase [Frondihabitans sp.]